MQSQHTLAIGAPASGKSVVLLALYSTQKGPRLMLDTRFPMYEKRWIKSKVKAGAILYLEAEEERTGLRFARSVGVQIQRIIHCAEAKS